MRNLEALNFPSDTEASFKKLLFFFYPISNMCGAFRSTPFNLHVSGLSNIEKTTFIINAAKCEYN